jgi:hypothetical protein
MDTGNANPNLSRRRKICIIAGVILAPVAWFMQFELNYALLPALCKTQQKFELQIISVVFLLFAAAGFVFAFQNYQDAKQHLRSSDFSGSQSKLAAQKFMGELGMMSSGLFLLIIVAQGIAPLIINYCGE